MLEFIREFSRSLAAKTLFFLIAAVFILWGMGGVISHLGTPDYLLKVGNLKTSAQEFDQAYRRAKETMRKRLGPLSEEQAQEMKLPEQVLSMFMQRSVRQLELENNALRLGDHVVKAAMRADPRFQDKSGVFNKDQLRAALASSRLSEEAFLRFFRVEIEDLLFSLPFRGGGFLSPREGFFPFSYREALTSSLEEKREVGYVRIDAKSVKAPARPDPEVLESFYKEHQEDFVAPEQRTVTVAEIDKNGVGKTITIEESEITQAYDQYVERSTDTETIKSLEEMREELEQDRRQELVAERCATIAREIEDAIASGKSFEEVAEAYPLANRTTTSCSAKMEKSHKFLPVDYKDVTEEIYKETMNQEEGSGTFLETTHGRWIFVRVDKIEAEHIMAFEEVKNNKVLACWQVHQQKEGMTTLAQKCLDILKEGRKLKDWAERQHFIYRTLEPFSRIDLSQKKTPTGEGITPEILVRLLRIPLGEGIMEVSQRTAESPGVIVVAVVTRTFPGEASKEPNPWGQSFAEDLRDQALRYNQTRHTIKLNEPAFKALGVAEPISYEG
jgi:peptidyl-prolyl cis-trans isomerase D